MISYCHKLDVCLCVSLLLVYPDETASEWRTFGMADRYRPAFGPDRNFSQNWPKPTAYKILRTVTTLSMFKAKCDEGRQ